MELIYSNTIAIASLLIFTLLYASWRAKKSKESTKNLPPVVGGAWPIIGHLRQLTAAKEPLVRTWGALADKYGPIFTVRIGMDPAVVVSSWEAARDCFSTNDKVLADRPLGCFGKYLGYDYAVMAFAAHGPYWRSVRKLVVVELLSNNTLEKLKPVWMSELEANIEELYEIAQQQPTKLNMSEWFGHLTLNLIVKLIGGRRYKYIPKGSAEEPDEEAQCMTKVFKQIMSLAGELVPADVFYPTGLFRWCDFGGYISSMKQTAKAMDDILNDWIDDHVKRRETGKKGDEDRDFIDVMLSVIDERFLSGHSYSRETVIKATALSMLQDAADTLGVNLEWILSQLLNNPGSMEKVREEIDNVVGDERWVEESDIDKLTYLQAVVKEGMRLYPAAPFLVQHQASEDCVVCGYTIPKGTTVYANAWKIQRDPQVWPEPEKFSPERFLESKTETMDSQSRKFGFIPFGIGRRSCPGMVYALKVTHLTFARLIQGFDVTTLSNAPVDMSEGTGITLPRATPLEVRITPRLPSFSMLFNFTTLSCNNGFMEHLKR